MPPREEAPYTGHWRLRRRQLPKDILVILVSLPSRPAGHPSRKGEKNYSGESATHLLLLFFFLFSFILFLTHKPNTFLFSFHFLSFRTYNLAFKENTIIWNIITIIKRNWQEHKWEKVNGIFLVQDLVWVPGKCRRESCNLYVNTTLGHRQQLVRSI